MAISGIQIYKMLPQTNCKDCGFPTCLAFAMKLAAKQVELAACPHVSDEATTKLASASEPPIRLIKVAANGHVAEAGNETVLFRHEKKFFNPTGIFIRICDDEPIETINARVAAAEQYAVDYVGIMLTIDGFAVKACAGDAASFASAVDAVRAQSKRPIILVANDPALFEAGLSCLPDEKPLLCSADESNLPAMVELAKVNDTPLAIAGDTLDVLADLTTTAKEAGLNDLVLHPTTGQMGEFLAQTTQIRRLALKKNFRPLGYPVVAFPGDADGVSENPALALTWAAQAIAKYAGFVVLNDFNPSDIYPLLVLRTNIYTDPQTPIQVKPGLYEINNPGPDAPLMITTNFSITYFSVANEIESAGIPAWLLVADAEGMSVLTAWAAGKFDAERIAKSVKDSGIKEKLNHTRIVLPGHVAVLSGEVEEELPGWEIKVGPREAVDIPSFVKQAL